jgi:uncharacterized membrane protein YedE/YeeE
MPTWFLAMLGGAMIGAACGLVLLTHGRIAGISNIASSLVQPATHDRGWRLAFLGGLIAAGLVARVVAPSAIGGSVRTLPVIALAGLLVGFGTRLGGGCTSGHGVCGVSRLSARSLVAVAVFMTTGALTVALVGAGA